MNKGLAKLVILNFGLLRVRRMRMDRSATTALRKNWMLWKDEQGIGVETRLTQ